MPYIGTGCEACRILEAVVVTAALQTSTYVLGIFVCDTAPSACILLAVNAGTCAHSQYVMSAV